jgi:hypothetical protein
MADEERKWGAQGEYVNMSWHGKDPRKTAVALDTISREVVYECYWTMHNSRPQNFVSGSGRPFAPVCMNTGCGQELGKMTMIVEIREEKLHANTPVLGWCACVCCKRCVAGMAVVDGEWRACPGCGYHLGHRDTYLMYPLTREGRWYNIQLGKQKRNNIKKREGDGNDILTS